jgi:hypothetical protein
MWQKQQLQAENLHLPHRSLERRFCSACLVVFISIKTKFVHRRVPSDMGTCKVHTSLLIKPERNCRSESKTTEMHVGLIMKSEGQYYSMPKTIKLHIGLVIIPERQYYCVPKSTKYISLCRRPVRHDSRHRNILARLKL